MLKFIKAHKGKRKFLLGLILPSIKNLPFLQNFFKDEISYQSSYCNKAYGFKDEKEFKEALLLGAKRKAAEHFLDNYLSKCNYTVEKERKEDILKTIEEYIVIKKTPKYDVIKKRPKYDDQNNDLAEY